VDDQSVTCSTTRDGKALKPSINHEGARQQRKVKRQARTVSLTSAEKALRLPIVLVPLIQSLNLLFSGNELIHFLLRLLSTFLVASFLQLAFQSEVRIRHLKSCATETHGRQKAADPLESTTHSEDVS
jgi:hypothetical protein